MEDEVLLILYISYHYFAIFCTIIVKNTLQKKFRHAYLNDAFLPCKATESWFVSLIILNFTVRVCCNVLLTSYGRCNKEGFSENKSYKNILWRNMQLIFFSVHSIITFFDSIIPGHFDSFTLSCITSLSIQSFVPCTSIQCKIYLLRKTDTGGRRKAFHNWIPFFILIFSLWNTAVMFSAYFPHIVTSVTVFVFHCFRLRRKQSICLFSSRWRWSLSVMK